MRRRTIQALILTLLGALLVVALPARATLLAANDPNTYAPEALSWGAGPGTSTGGMFTAAYIIGNYEVGAFFEPGNSLCAGCLTFVFYFTNGPGDLGQDSITRATIGDFTGFQTNVGYDLSGGGLAPVSVDRLGTGVIGFNFTEAGVGAGQYSSYLVIETDATAYGPGTISLFGSSTETSMAGFAPSAVPEPGSILLLASGLIALGSMLSRRRRV